MKALALMVALLAASPAALAQPAPFYGQELSGAYGVFDQDGAQLCRVELTNRYNEIRETFMLDASACPDPLGSARRWELERGMGTGRHQIAFWSGGLTPAWRGTVPDPAAGVWIGRTSDGQSLELRPESDGPRAWLRGEPQARRQASLEASALRPGDLLGVYQLSPRNGYPRDCYLTLFRGPNGGGRVLVQGDEACGPLRQADRFNTVQGALVLADRQRQRLWSGAIRHGEGGVRIVGGDRDASRWELNRLGAALPSPEAGLDRAALAGDWRFEEMSGPSCQLSLGLDGRVRAARACGDPGQLFGRWRVEGDLIILSDSWTLNPTDLWSGRIVNLDTVEGRGLDVRVGSPPRRINRSRLVR